MKLDCPLFTLVVDMEDLPGYVEFMKRNAKELGRRLGQRYPLATKLSREETLKNISASINWLCTAYLQDSAYQFFQLEKGDQAPGTLLTGNANLFLMLDEMTRRSESLTSIVKQAIAPDGDTVMRMPAATWPRPGQKEARDLSAASCSGSWKSKAPSAGPIKPSRRMPTTTPGHGIISSSPAGSELGGSYCWRG